MVNLKCFFNKIKIVTCKPAGNEPRDGRLPGKHIMIRVVNCIVPLLQLEADCGVAGGGRAVQARSAVPYALPGWLSWAATHNPQLTSGTHSRSDTAVSLPVELFVCFVVPLPAGAVATAAATVAVVVAVAVCCATHSLVVGTLLEVDCNQITQATCFDKYVYTSLHIVHTHRCLDT